MHTVQQNAEAQQVLKVARQVKIMLYSLIDLSALSADRAELEGRMDKPVHRTRCELQECLCYLPTRSRPTLEVFRGVVPCQARPSLIGQELMRNG